MDPPLLRDLQTPIGWYTLQKVNLFFKWSWKATGGQPRSLRVVTGGVWFGRPMSKGPRIQERI